MCSAMHGSEIVKLLAIIEVLIAVLLNSPVFTHVTLCCWVSTCQHFNHSAFIFSVWQPKEKDCWMLKTKALHFFKSSEIAYNKTN